MEAAANSNSWVGMEVSAPGLAAANLNIWSDEEALAILSATKKAKGLQEELNRMFQTVVLSPLMLLTYPDLVESQGRSVSVVDAEQRALIDQSFTERREAIASARKEELQLIEAFNAIISSGVTDANRVKLNDVLDISTREADLRTSIVGYVVYTKLVSLVEENKEALTNLSCNQAILNIFTEGPIPNPITPEYVDGQLRKVKELIDLIKPNITPEQTDMDRIEAYELFLSQMDKTIIIAGTSLQQAKLESRSDNPLSMGLAIQRYQMEVAQQAVCQIGVEREGSKVIEQSQLLAGDLDILLGDSSLNQRYESARTIANSGLMDELSKDHQMLVWRYLAEGGGESRGLHKSQALKIAAQINAFDPDTEVEDMEACREMQKDCIIS